LVLLALVFAVLAAPSEAAFPKGKNGKIVHSCGIESMQLNQFDLCSINTDGTDRLNLTNTPGSALDEGPAAFSPDGRRIVFRSFQAGGGGLELINSDGSGRTLLLPRTADSALAPGDPTFSPDGHRVFFLRGSTNQGDIYAINSDGSGEVNLTRGAFGAEPTVSPDGNTIAFSRFVTGPCVPPQPFMCSGPHIFSMSTDGSAQTNLTGTTTTTSEREPAFTPDGRIVFVGSANSASDIWVMNGDGTGQRNLSNTAGVGEREPEVSPDGRLIAYGRDDSDGLWVMNSDGSAQHPLASTPGPSGYQQESDPTWEPIQKCGGRRATIVGDDGPDTLKGTKRGDVIMGFGGKDRIKGRGGNDRICGGAGKDKLVAGAGAKDLCVGGKGKDKAKGCERGKV
jgi:Tol biopolymer transport system component